MAHRVVRDRENSGMECSLGIKVQLCWRVRWCQKTRHVPGSNMGFKILLFIKGNYTSRKWLFEYTAPLNKKLCSCHFHTTQRGLFCLFWKELILGLLNSKELMMSVKLLSNTVRFEFQVDKSGWSIGEILQVRLEVKRELGTMPAWGMQWNWELTKCRVRAE